jgi:triacylglycerol esterase/lipase EstA (alpha/beta hydrolase family)
MVIKRVLAVVAALAVSLSAFASDIEKEKRWADQIVDALVDGEAVWLSAGDHKFLGIYTPAEDGDTSRGAIIVHGIGAHPDWPQVVHPLRTRLPALGWSTLSLQMPILGNDAEDGAYASIIDEAISRLDAGVRFLREQGIKHIVVIAHSMGSTMASYYLSTGKRDVEGFVAIGMPEGIRNSAIDNAVMIQKTELPVFDLYGSNDLDTVLAGVPKRSEVKGNTGGQYTSQRVEGANHFFQGQDDALVEVTQTWLGATIGTE